MLPISILPGSLVLGYSSTLLVIDHVLYYPVNVGKQKSLTTAMTNLQLASMCLDMRKLQHSTYAIDEDIDG